MATKTKKRRAKGEGGLYQRDDGRWVAAIQTPEGRKYLTAKTRDAALQKMKTAKEDIAKGVIVTAPTQTVNQFLNRYLEDVKKPTVEESTYAVYELIARQLSERIGKLKLNALTPTHVQNLWAKATQEGKSKRWIEASHRFLRMAMKHAVHMHLLPYNPTDGVTCPHPKGPERVRILPLTVDQMNKLLDTAKGDRYYPIILFIATTATRLGEATGLRWRDIDWERHCFTILQTVQHLPRGLVIKPHAKSMTSRRTIHLTDMMLEELKALRKEQAAERLQAGPAWQDNGLVFCNPDGRPCSPNQVYKALRRIVAKAELPPFGPHNLRHSAATFLLTQGVDIKHIQVFLGHSTIQVTADFYLHLAPGSKEISNLFDRTLAPRVQPAARGGANSADESS